MRTLFFAFAFLIGIGSWAQDIVKFESHAGKTYDVTLPAYGEIKLKSGEKIKGLITVVTNDSIDLKTITKDEATLREAKKNKTLTTEERNNMLFIFPETHKKGDVQSVSFIKQRDGRSENLKKAGVYGAMGLALAAGILSAKQDIENDSFPFVATGCVAVIGGLFWIANKTASKKLDFYKWKIK